MKNFAPAFWTAIALSLAGFANLGFAERYETVFVKTDDTAAMSSGVLKTYLKSSACISTETLEVPEGEVAYVFAVGAVTRPNSTIQGGFIHDAKPAYIPCVIVDVDGLDANQSLGSWNPNTANWNNASISNISSSVQPIAGPAVVRIIIKPYSGTNNTSWYWDSGNKSFDCQASEGYVTFRIVGSQQEVSKKFATVIPENSSGNVDIILEQSTDLINWTAVNPGSFPPSTAKRFFRVRSQE